jgi:hypothetical protein
MHTDERKALKKPLSIYLVSIGYLGAMVLNIFQIYTQGRPPYLFQIVFTILYPVAAYGIFKVKRWGWYLVISHILFLLISNSVLALSLHYYDNWLLIQLNLLLLFFLWFFLRSSVRSPFHNAALRWWERQYPRYGATFKLTLRTPSGESIAADGINLSMGGCFIKLGSEHRLALQDRVEVELVYEDFEPFRAKGRVTWITEQSELNPRGAGIAFKRADRPNRMLLRAILRMVEARWVKSAQQHAPAEAPSP